jgi:hypothetical protein
MTMPRTARRADALTSNQKVSGAINGEIKGLASTLHTQGGIWVTDRAGWNGRFCRDHVRATAAARRSSTARGPPKRKGRVRTGLGIPFRSFPHPRSAQSTPKRGGASA